MVFRSLNNKIFWRDIYKDEQINWKIRLIILINILDQKIWKKKRRKEALTYESAKTLLKVR